MSWCSGQSAPCPFLPIAEQVLTRSGWWTVFTAAVLFVGWLILGYPILIALAVGLGVVLAVGLVFVLRAPTLNAHQSLSPAIVGVAEPATAVVTVRNGSERRSPAVRAVEIVDGTVHRVDVPSLPAGESTSVSFAVATERRGVFGVGPLQIERSDPFRLFARTTHRGGTLQLTVHPAIHHVPPLPTGLRRELEGAASQRPQEGGISFHSLREYVPGDDLRLVHWRSVAKQTDGTLLVRKNVVTSEPRLMVLLDTSADPYTDESFEDAVRIAASLVAAGCDSHYPVMFRTTGGFGADASATGEGRLEILTMLAQIQRSDDDPGLNGVLHFAERVEGVSLGAVTGQPDPERTVGISRSRSRFDMVSVAQVGEAFSRPPMRIPGAVVVNGPDSVAVAEAWKARFG